MNSKHQHLMKHFAAVLKKRSQEDQPLKASISPELSRYVSRRDLLEIIHQKHEGTIPKSLDLLAMENEELLLHIADELLVIAHLCLKWSKSALIEKTPAKDPKLEALETLNGSKPALKSDVKTPVKPKETLKK